MLGCDDKIVVGWSASGTQHGKFGSIPQTGQRVTWSGIHIFQFGSDDKIAQYWTEACSLNRLIQLGVQLVPPSTAPTEPT
jgi:predicted ester cyclase